MKQAYSGGIDLDTAEEDENGLALPGFALLRVCHSRRE